MDDRKMRKSWNVKPVKYRRCAEKINTAARKVGQRFKLLTREKKLV